MFQIFLKFQQYDEKKNNFKISPKMGVTLGSNINKESGIPYNIQKYSQPYFRFFFNSKYS